MTTPTPAEVGHGSKEPTVVEIDGFRGRLISAYHTDYDIARAVWNGAIDRRPHLIARCIGTADVVAAVRFARDHDLEIAIRGGGHNVAGTAVCDDGIVIDLSAMRGVRVDRAVGRFREGVYVNFLGGDEDPERVREAYGDSVYDRLVDVKTTYDPDNVFHHNQNIRPGLSPPGQKMNDRLPKSQRPLAANAASTGAAARDNGAAPWRL